VKDIAKGRLYLVTENGAYEKIVEATSQAQAIRIVAGERFKARAATARDVQKIMAAKEATITNVEITSKEGR
jgi:hypothetical protein